MSNGSWAKTPEKASHIMKAMRDAGLNELNISTGDNHQAWVPFDIVLNAIGAASANSINSIIVVEGYRESNFKIGDVYNNRRFQNLQRRATDSENFGSVGVMNNIWIPMHLHANVTQQQKYYVTAEQANLAKGCDNVLTTLGLNPYGQVIDCCGLTMEYIDSMKLGTYRNGTLKEMFNKQFNDFMKIWLWVDGPEKILYFASTLNHQINFPVTISHPCQACVELYKNPIVRETLQKNYEKVVPEIMLKYSIKLERTNAERKIELSY